jgi:hypothetical protein
MASSAFDFMVNFNIVEFQGRLIKTLQIPTHKKNPLFYVVIDSLIAFKHLTKLTSTFGHNQYYYP